MLRIPLIFLGAGLGGLARYLLGSAVQSLTGSVLPVGTLVVNILGCLAIGFLSAALTTGPFLIREEYRLGIIVGVLGGFTTFSSFGYETVQLAADRQYLFAALNILLSNAAGLGAVWAGVRLAERLYGV